MKPAVIFRAWAPLDGAWTPWVKPVLFAAMGEDAARFDAEGDGPLPAPPDWFSAEALARVDARSTDSSDPYREHRSLHDAAIVIDLPSVAGAELGVALTAYGFRPIPLYNAIPSDVGIVDLRPLMELLARSAVHVEEVARSAPPAFLLDADRMVQGKVLRAGLFDNRSMCRAQDFPSVDRLEQAGIRRILLVCDSLQDDLHPIALAWQSAGLELWWKGPTDPRPASPITVKRPWLGRRIWNQWFPLALQPSANGAYGVLVEEASSA